MPPMNQYPTFILTPPFDEDWSGLGLDDADLARLEQQLIANPQAGAVVGGTGGLRKVRFAPLGRGKSGGVRVCYAHFGRHFLFLLVAAYGKTQKSDLTPAEKRAIARMISEYERNLPPPRNTPPGDGGDA